MYTFDSRIRYSETDENAILTIESLINYFQDCSTFQTEDAGAGLSWLSAQHLAWVLNYWQIDICRLPRLCEHVRVGTVPYELKGFAGLRNYFMETVPGNGQQAERLATANSVWALMDMEKMFPSRVSSEHASRYDLEEKLPMEYLDRKIRLPEGGDVIEAEAVIVDHSHLDTNRHVNNGQYVRIALSALSELLDRADDSIRIFVTPGTLSAGSVRIRAEYKKQAHLGDVLTPVLHLYDGTQGKRAIAVDMHLNGESACVVELSGLSGTDT
ncbi:MAG: acyl-[Lachnospiraceae bacterium]|nr:acyl-[acyl-carrier-protein] thioesterase [Lachnospiraceae bacterium]